MIFRKLYLFLIAIPSFTDTKAEEILEIGKEQYQIHCIACHVTDESIVGPSLIEISRLYQKDNTKHFIEWCLAPGKKRPDSVQMPSMAHVGEKNLAAIHSYLLEEVKGKKQKRPTKVRSWKQDDFPMPKTRPLVQRMFLENSGPATITVALAEHDLNFAFDAGSCRLRFVWQGAEFIRAWPYWQSNGNAIVRIVGEMRYEENSPPFQAADSSNPEEVKFLNYQLDKAGIPTFRYHRGGVLFEEKITANQEGDGIIRRLKTDGSTAIKLTTPENAQLESNPKSDLLTAEQARDFSLHLKWIKP